MNIEYCQTCGQRGRRKEGIGGGQRENRTCTRQGIPAAPGSEAERRKQTAGLHDITVCTTLNNSGTGCRFAGAHGESLV